MSSEKAQDATRRAQGARGAKKSGSKGKAAKGQKKRARANVGAQKAKKLSGLDAAAKVLAEAGEPLSCKVIVERAFEKGYWASEGKTPAATIYAAMLREIQKKGDASRFRKAARGKFELAT